MPEILRREKSEILDFSAEHGCSDIAKLGTRVLLFNDGWHKTDLNGRRADEGNPSYEKEEPLLECPGCHKPSADFPTGLEYKKEKQS